MGWSYHYPGRGPKNAAEYRAEIARLATWECDDCTVSPVAIGVVGTTYYVAARSAPKRPDAVLPGSSSAFIRAADGSYVTALVILTRRPTEREGWGYKDMCETMGPAEAKAPRKVLKALSPLNPDHDCDFARNWRARCEAWANRVRLTDGIVIQLKERVEFQNGWSASRFRKKVEDWFGRKRTIWIAVDAGDRRCRLEETYLYHVGFDVVAPEPASEERSKGGFAFL